MGDNRVGIEIPGVQDANEILEELGHRAPCILSDIWTVYGNENYTLNEDGTGYVLTKSIEELQEDGSIVLTGTEVESATAGALSDKTTSATEYGVDPDSDRRGYESVCRGHRGGI